MAASSSYEDEKIEEMWKRLLSLEDEEQGAIIPNSRESNNVRIKRYL